jgi:hypothetical protein
MLRFLLCAAPALQILYDLRFTANQFVLTPVPLRLTIRDASPFVLFFIASARISQKTQLLAALILFRGYPLCRYAAFQTSCYSIISDLPEKLSIESFAHDSERTLVRAQYG